MTPVSVATHAPARHARTQTQPSATRTARDRLPVAIIGAGIGGLSLSRVLAARAVPHLVLERAEEPGGAIRTVEVQGRVLEAGPQRTRLTPAIRSLVKDLGLERELLVAPRDLPLFIYRAEKLRVAPLSLAQLLETDLFSIPSKLRLLAEPFTPSASSDETVAEYFTRRFGLAAYEDLLGPLFGGLYASDPKDMLVRHALLPALREMGAEHSAILSLFGRAARGGDAPAACSFRRGMRALTDALLDSVRAHARLATPVFGIERNETGAECYRVITGDDSIDARAVVLTCPASEAAKLLAGVAPDAALRLPTLTYNRLALVHLVAAEGCVDSAIRFRSRRGCAHAA